MAATKELRTARNISDNGMEVEQPKNGQVDQQIRRRPDPADAFSRTTDGFFHSHSLGLAGSQSLPKPRQSSLRPTPNGDHDNGSANSAKRSTANRGKSRAAAWDLPNLIRPLPVRKQPCRRQPRLLDHHPAMVEFVYTNRFATAAQIQRRFSEYVGSYRTAQYQLAGLVQVGYLQTAPVRSTSPNFPYVYYATARGVNLIKDAYAALGQSWTGAATESVRTKGVALQSLLHELLVTEFDLAVQQTIDERGELKRLFLERRFFHRDRQLRYANDGRMRRLIPDSGFLLRSAERQLRTGQVQQRLMMHFTEVDNGTMSIKRLQNKFWNYAVWSQSHEAQAYLERLHRSFGASPGRMTFRLLVVAHGNTTTDQRRLLDLLISTLELRSSMRDRIWITTVDALHLQQQAQSPLVAPIWLRLRDCRSWAQIYRSNVAGVSTTFKNKQLASRRAFVADQVARMPLHAFFSSPATHKTSGQVPILAP